MTSNLQSLDKANAHSLAKELEWFTKVLDTRMKLYFGAEAKETSIFDIPLPDLEGQNSKYATFVQYYRCTIGERLLLILSLVPHIQPEILDVFYTQNQLYNRGHTEFGGVMGQTHGGFLPTGETAAFLLGGRDLDLRFEVENLLGPTHFFRQQNVLWLEQSAEDEPHLSGRLVLSQEYILFFTQGTPYHPPFSARFPAKEINTPLEWEDLVIGEGIRYQLEEIKGWMQFGDILLNDWNLKRVIKPGYRCLFYGPPGTGKTMTAKLLGKSANFPVYRIDLSKVISKYIGETEKSLTRVFDMAEHKNWLLFFDEADSLFSKRTETQNSNDRSANQQVAYLLQRIEDYSGMAILASNLHENLDEAFTRRFDSIIYFDMPDEEHRLKLWQNYFQQNNEHYQLDEDVKLEGLARNYELAGGNIINILRYCCIKAISRGENIIKQLDIIMGIRK